MRPLDPRFPTLVLATCVALPALALVPPAMAQGTPQNPSVPFQSLQRRPVLNAGGLDVDDFGYTDPHAPEHQPLKHPTLALRDRAELALYLPGRNSDSVLGWILDDPATGFAELDDSLALNGLPSRVRSAATGNQDTDAADELVTVSIDPGGLGLTLEVFEQDRFGGLQFVSAHPVPGMSYLYHEADIALGDVDGDLRDEWIVTARPGHKDSQVNQGWLRVYDDPLDGGALLLDFPYTYEHTFLQPASGDLDGDGRHEVLLLGENGLASHGDMWIRAWDLDPDAGSFAPIGDWYRFEDDLGDMAHGVLTVGDYDTDGLDELCIVSCVGHVNSSGLHYVRRVLHGVELVDGDLVSFGRTVANLTAGPAAGNNERDWDACNLNRGADEVATLTRHGSTQRLQRHAWDAQADAWVLVEDLGSMGTVGAGRTGMSLDAGDLDADGLEELVVGFVRATSNQRVLDAFTVDWAPTPVFDGLPTRVVGDDNGGYPAIIAPGDFDADGLVLESTGEKFLSVADPVPLVLLVAPPTLADVAQNLDDSETVYEETVSTSESVGVSVSSAISGYAGLSTPDLVGMFSASGGVRLESTFQRNEVETTTVSYSTGYGTSADSDALVFQGTLFHNYEYRVVSSPEPSQVGQELLISLPVATNTYKWTVDFYNASVDPAYRVPDAVRPHDVGDPWSYPSLADVQASMGANLGWRSPNAVPVGQGGSSISREISLATEQTTEEERTFSTSLEAGFSVGPVDVESSFTWGGGDSYSVSFGEENTYTGVVGDIASSADWTAWNYAFGLSITHHGVDANGDPIPGEVPFQVVGYWVE